VISDYLESLVGALSFDRSLSRRVRQEVEDHLREAVAADPMGDGLEARFSKLALRHSKAFLAPTLCTIQSVI
jgi:dsRNA-specific ribonuclease